MKRSGRCPKCDGSVIYVAHVADEDDNGMKPMRIARHVERQRVLGMSMDVTTSVGELEAGVCRDCGYTGLKRKRAERSGRSPWSRTFPRNCRPRARARVGARST